MATGTTPTVYIEHDTAVAVWTNEAGTSLPANTARYIANCIQLTNGVTASIQGSNDGANWSALHEATPTAAALTNVADTAVHEILENPLWIRIVVSAGTGGAILVLRTSA